MSKQTSLASQLRKLETPQTSVLRETKSRVSFLYDRKEAVSIDKDTHFIIGLSGFRQICTIDESFREFERLFSISSKDLDRAMLSKDDNENLNKVIRKFLFQVVSPYFLLSHTHKMLEWLIYRFSVHEYNLDDLIVAVLPYHETKFFPRVVQLNIKIRDASHKWHWLHSVAKHDVPLPKASLITHLKSNSSTIDSLMDHILKTVKNQHKIPVVISFFTSSLVNILEDDDFILENSFKNKFLLKILEFIRKSSRSEEKSLVQSSYIVLSQLVTRTSIESSILGKILSKMAKHFTAYSSDEVIERNFLLTLLIVYEFQELEKMTSDVAAVVNLDRFIEITSQMKSNYFLTSLLKHYINVINDDDEYMKCIQLIDNLKLTSRNISKLLEAIVENKSNGAVDDSKLSNIVKLLERRFPTEFDEATSQTNIIGLEDLIISPFYTRFNDKNLNVFVGLTNANEGIRFHSACHIAKNHKEIMKCTDAKTKECIADALINTLHESSPLVLIELLSCRDLFIKMIPLSNLIVYGKKLLPRCIEMIGAKGKYENEETHNDWITVRRSCFKLVSNLDFKDESQFWDLFIDYFLPLDATGLSLFSVIFETDIEKTNQQLFNWTKSIYTEEFKTFIANEDYGSSIDLITQRIAQHINKHPNSPLLNVLNQSGADNYRKQVLGLCIVFHLLPLQVDNYESLNKLSLTCISILSNLVNPKYAKFKKNSSEESESYNNIKDFINSSIKCLTRRRVTSGMIQLFVSRIIEFKKLPNIQTWFWHFQTTENNYIHGLFNFLCHESHHGKVQSLPVFQNLLKFFISEMMSFCPKFLIGLWTKTEDPLLQARALQISAFAFKKAVSDEISLISLCIALQSPNSSVRCEAVKILDIDSVGSFLHFLVPFKELLIGDDREISIAIAKFLSENSSHEGTSFTFKSLYKHLKNPTTPSSLRVDIANMLRDFNTIECLKLFLDLCDAPLKIADPSSSEKQLCYLAGRKIIEMFPVLESPHKQVRMIHLLNQLLMNDNYRPMLLSLFDNAYVKQLSSDGKMLIIKSLLNIIDVKNDNYSRRKLKKFLTDGEIIAKIIDGIIIDGKEADECDTAQPKRRRIDKRLVEQNSSEWKKIVILLEIFASKDTFDGAEKLMETVFKLLKDNLISEEQSSSEYFRSLLLVILSSCLDQADINLSNFELAYILESLRHARLRETRMQALSIINRISSHMKDDILRDIIVIFGFIGNDMIKCDDQYTHKILDDTMETIIPGLVLSNEDSQKKIIETFIDAFNDIPLHRRLYLFQKLSSLLGEEKCLWFIIYKLIRRSQDVEDSKKFIQEFASALVCSFDATIQMTTINQLMTMCMEILTKGFFDTLGEIYRINEASQSDFVREVVGTIYLIVDSEDYVSAIAKSKWSDMADLFRKLFETNLLLVDHSINRESKSNRYASRLTRELLRVLEKVNCLLPGPEFVLVIRQLLDPKSSGLVVRRKALELLNARLTKSMSNNSQKSDISMLCEFFDPIVNIIVGVKENKSDLQIVTSQTGLMSIKILSKLLDGDPDSIKLKLTNALESIISLSEKRSEIPNNNLFASIILCIAQLVSCLQDDCLSFIPSVMSITLATLKETSDVLILSSLTALSKITKCFGKFLSSNLIELLVSICSLKKDTSISGMSIRVDKVNRNLTSEVPFRILISSLESAYDQLEEPESLYVCLSIFTRGLSNCDKTDIEANLPNLQKFALRLMDYRSINSKDMEISVITKIEEKSLEAITTFVPKLSESSFRTFFHKIYDWVREGDGYNYHRIITFYRLTNKLSDKLKNLFSAFAAPYIVINCVKQLKSFQVNSDEGVFKSLNNKNERVSMEEIGHLILFNILTTLSKSFQHDTGSTFSTADRTKKLYPLMLDQITNYFGSNDDYTARIDNGLIPCIQHLVRAVNDHNIVKDLNYQLLLKTRENSAKIRYQALHVLHQLILSMTEEYTPYLPEAIPFLAELHEDDSESIQKLLLTVFSDIEQIFGEPISTYF